jgi:hypothetical protein
MHNFHRKYDRSYPSYVATMYLTKISKNYALVIISSRVNTWYFSNVSKRRGA